MAHHCEGRSCGDGRLTAGRRGTHGRAISSADPDSLTPVAPGSPLKEPKRPSLLLLAFLAMAFLGTCAWQTRSKVEPTSIGYSRAFALVAEGKVKSVVLTGQAMDGELAEPQQIDGSTVRQFRSLIRIKIRPCFLYFAKSTWLTC